MCVLPSKFHKGNQRCKREQHLDSQIAWNINNQARVHACFNISSQSKPWLIFSTMFSGSYSITFSHKKMTIVFQTKKLHPPTESRPQGRTARTKIKKWDGTELTGFCVNELKVKCWRWEIEAGWNLGAGILVTVLFHVIHLLREWKSQAGNGRKSI